MKLTIEDILKDEMFKTTEIEKELFNVSKLPNRKLNTYAVRTSNETIIDFSTVNDMKLVSFNGVMEINSYFVLNGVTGFLKSINNNRTEIYFENGTQSKMLYKSLISMMRTKGKKFQK